MIKFEELGLSKEIVKAIEEMGYENPTQIQLEAIPAILNRQDVLGRSHTGTGKTAAFGLPIIEMIEPSSIHPQVLILAPTRELDLQIATELRKFSKYKEGVKIVPIYGGESIEYQIKLLKRGCSIVVGTPGRVMDHLRRKTLRLDQINMVVLDEADEMLNMGFKEDIETILGYMTQQYQMALFSATMPEAILEITRQFQHDPVNIEVKSAQRTIDTVEQVYYECKRGKKTDALRLLLSTINPELTMIFTNTKKMVEDLVDELNTYDIKAIGLHGDMKQQNRTRVMEQFKARNYPILIATDVAARGIDVDDIDLVVNYDIPQDNEYYIHRVGRTGRAGKKGKAITLVSGKNQLKFIKEIAKYTKTKIPAKPLPSSEELIQENKRKYIEDVKRVCDEPIDETCFEIMNELLSEGISIENILSALISLSYKPLDVDVKDLIEKKREKKERNFFEGETITLHFNIGRNMKITASHLVAAITEYTNLSSAIIGKIELMTKYSLVDIQKEYANTVINAMSSCTIKGLNVNVKEDQPLNKEEKRKKSRDKKDPDILEVEEMLKKEAKKKKSSRKDSRKRSDSKSKEKKNDDWKPRNSSRKSKSEPKKRRTRSDR